MTGSYDSVIGVEVEDALYRVINSVPNRFTIAKGDVRLSAIEIEIDNNSGKALSINRIFQPVDEKTI